jgi:hypothetical protein
MLAATNAAATTTTNTGIVAELEICFHGFTIYG